MVFQAKGLRVFATVRNREAVRDLADAGIETLELEVTSEKSINACKEVVAERTGGRLDYLVNNAGRTTEVELSEIQALFDTNLFAVMRLCQAFIPLLRQCHGTIVQIGSVAGIIPYAWSSVYNASKAALHSYSDTLRLELAPLGIHVITVVTGGVESRIARVKRSLGDDSVYKKIESGYQARQSHTQVKDMGATEYAEQVVKKVLNARGQLWNTRKIWAGAKAETVRWSSWLLPDFMLDRRISRMCGFDQL
ncbi:MAG: hypothetical protein Q9169_008574 [Polycauliona sp. 2 TL-2023]